MGQGLELEIVFHCHFSFLNLVQIGDIVINVTDGDVSIKCLLALLQEPVVLGPQGDYFFQVVAAFEQLFVKRFVYPQRDLVHREGGGAEQRVDVVSEQVVVVHLLGFLQILFSQLHLSSLLDFFSS